MSPEDFLITERSKTEVTLEETAQIEADKKADKLAESTEWSKLQKSDTFAKFQNLNMSKDDLKLIVKFYFVGK